MCAAAREHAVVDAHTRVPDGRSPSAPTCPWGAARASRAPLPAGADVTAADNRTV